MMANKHKTRRKFNGPRGRHSGVAKKRYSLANKAVIEQVNAIKRKSSNLFRPYRIVRCASSLNDVSLRIKVQRLSVVRSSAGEKCASIIHPGNPMKMSVHMRPNELLSENRILDVGKLQEYISDSTAHVMSCEVAIAHFKQTSASPLSALVERSRSGLASTITSTCKCGKVFTLENSDNISVPSTEGDKQQHDVNVRAVWGTMVTGGGVSRMNETLSTMNLPTMTQHMFTSLENSIGTMWYVHIIRSVTIQEIRIAIFLCAQSERSSGGI